MEVMVFRLWLAVITVKHTCDLDKERQCSILMLSFSAAWHQPLPIILYSRLFHGIDLEKLQSAVTHQCLEKFVGSLCQSHQPDVRNPSNSHRGSKACLAFLQGLRAWDLLCGGCLSLRKVCEASRPSVGTALVQVLAAVFFAYPCWGEVQAGKMMAGQVVVEKSWILHGVQFPASSMDTDFAPGNYFAVPLETYAMESAFCPADPRKCFEKHSNMLECSLNGVSSGEILSSGLWG